MRPRVFPAEDIDGVDVRSVQRDASMRPRVFPAEDRSWRRGEPPCAPRFNEAAGIPRGRLGRAFDDEKKNIGFNEAAGIPRGRRGTSTNTTESRSSFNEAAGIPRGRRLTDRAIDMSRSRLQ